MRNESVEKYNNAIRNYYCGRLAFVPCGVMAGNVLKTQNLIVALLIMIM